MLRLSSRRQKRRMLRRPSRPSRLRQRYTILLGGGLGSDSAWPSVWALREYAQGRDVCRWSLRMLIPPASYSERAGGACGAPRNTTQREERARSIPGAGRAHGCWSHAWCRHSPRLCPGCQISGCVAWLHKLQRRDSQQDLGVN
jgi:hypothetical protein